MVKWIKSVLVLSLFVATLSSSVRADVTINNFQSATVSQSNAVLHFDTNGNAIDAHDGNILQCVSGMPNCALGTMYLYGTAYNCGFDWTVSGPWCGFHVYETTDLKVWKDDGLIFDPSTWQAACAPNGCDRPRMVYNAANNNYVLWFNILSGSGDHYRVFTCTTPISGCTQQAQPVGILHPSGGDEFIFVDPASGNGYIAYSSGNGGNSEIYVQQLNSSFTDAMASVSDTGVVGEGVAMFEQGGNYYVLYGAGCPYCGATDTHYVSAVSPLGNYGAAIQLSSATCDGQSNSVDTIQAAGHTTYLFRADQWLGPNQGPSTQYFQPLSFTGSAINNITCAPTVTVLGLTLSGPNVAPGSPDQADFTDAYVAQCGPQQNTYWFFTFVPGVTPLASVGIATGIWPFSSTMTANLTIDLTTVSANQPGTVLASTAFTVASALTTPQFILFPLHYPVTPGTTYGISMHSATASTGCFLVMQSNSTQYASGLVSKSTNSGSTYSTLANTSVLFATFGPNTSPSGRRFLLNSNWQWAYR